MAINWELGVAPDIIGNALTARREAQDHRQQMERQNALLDMQRQRMSMDQAEITRKQQEQRRADLPLIGRLLEQSTDDATYQQARGVAQQYGIDVSGLPQTFDPAWRDQQLAIVKTLSDPTKMEALSTAGKAAVDMGYKPGTPEFNKAVNEIWAAGESKPYVVGGETRLYTPKIGGPGQVQGGPQAGVIEDGYRFKGGNPADPNSWEPVGQGGPAAAPQTPFAQAFQGF